jgi:hypothetical protein
MAESCRYHVGKHMFSDTGNNGPQTSSQTGQNLYEKPCRIGVSSGNFAFYVFRRKNRGFRLTPPCMSALCRYEALQVDILVAGLRQIVGGLHAQPYISRTTERLF